MIAKLDKYSMSVENYKHFLWAIVGIATRKQVRPVNVGIFKLLNLFYKGYLHSMIETMDRKRSSYV